MIRILVGAAALIVAAAIHSNLPAQESGSPEGLRAEQKLPERYPFVARDILEYCQPTKGFWVDLGGKAQVAIPLIEATGRRRHARSQHEVDDQGPQNCPRERTRRPPLRRRRLRRSHAFP